MLLYTKSSSKCPRQRPRAGTNSCALHAPLQGTQHAPSLLCNNKGIYAPLSARVTIDGWHNTSIHVSTRSKIWRNIFRRHFMHCCQQRSAQHIHERLLGTASKPTGLKYHDETQRAREAAAIRLRNTKTQLQQHDHYCSMILP